MNSYEFWEEWEPAEWPVAVTWIRKPPQVKLRVVCVVDPQGRDPQPEPVAGWQTLDEAFWTAVIRSRKAMHELTKGERDELHQG